MTRTQRGTVSTDRARIGSWTVRAVGGPVPEWLRGLSVPATTPGCVHTDLLAAGLIPDPFLDSNEELVSWIARVDWRYEAELESTGPAGPGRVDLVVLGLDTVATVELNGEVLARTANMHRSYRLPVGDRLRDGTNELAVTFRSALDAAERSSRELGPLPATVEHPINAIRKMACNFGADWGPELVTAGIWRPLLLHAWTTARIASVRPLVDVVDGVGVLRAHVAVEREGPDAGELTVSARVAGLRVSAALPPGESTAVLQIAVPDVQLWWPAGHGDQTLYDLDIALAGPAGALEDWAGRVGFRTVRAETTPDADGTPFTLVVNGEPVFVRGVNWIPDDPFPSRVGPDAYRERLTQARDLHANLVRVWGGGIFEDDVFYDTCDELGLMVWQDFMFNCACYSEDEPLRGEILAEAREAVTRLCRHPGLVLWNGCNENLWGYRDWGWQEPLAGRAWGSAYWFELLPAIVAELDPGRPYLPGSPWSMSWDHHPLDPAHGTTHRWDVWNTTDWTAYRDQTPRFCSEFGFQGPPTWATLTRAVHDDPLIPSSPGIAAHEKAVDGLGKLARGMAPHFAGPGTVQDWHWAASLNQARALTCGVEHLRSRTPVCMGSVVWQLNDCWPVISWSLVDGDGRRKPSWYALRRSYRDRLLTFQPRDGGPVLVAVNDDPRPWTADVRVSRRGMDGASLAGQILSLSVPARGAVTLALPDTLTAAGDPAGELLLAEIPGDRAWWFFSEDVDSRLPDPVVDVAVRAVPDGYLLDLTARTLVRDLAVLVDHLDPDAVVDDMLHTLLPGERVVVGVQSTAALTTAGIADPLVLRSANQLTSRNHVPARDELPGHRRVTRGRR